MPTLGGVPDQKPANDNALAEWLDSEEAQSASPRTVLLIAQKLAKCATVSPEVIRRLQRLLDSA
jgi:hypothetical protein